MVGRPAVCVCVCVWEGGGGNGEAEEVYAEYDAAKPSKLIGLLKSPSSYPLSAPTASAFERVCVGGGPTAVTTPVAAVAAVTAAVPPL